VTGKDSKFLAIEVWAFITINRGFYRPRTIVESVQRKISELAVGIFGRMVDAICASNRAPHSSSRGHSFHRGISGLCRKQVGHYLMTDLNRDIQRSPLSLLGSVMVLDFHLRLIADPSRNTNLIEIGKASGRWSSQPTSCKPNLLHEDFGPDYKGSQPPGGVKKLGDLGENFSLCIGGFDSNLWRYEI